MPTFHEIVYALFGALRLARFDVSGLTFFDPSAAAALRSFTAALVVLPIYILLILVRPAEDGEGASWPTLMVVEAIAYVCSWTAYALVMDEVSRLLDRGPRYPLFLSVYNWSSVVQMMVYLPTVMIAQSGVLPVDLSESLEFLVTLAILIYQWFTTKLTLEIPGLTAAGLVLIDMLLSMLISGSADSMR
jgi:hypothetical protein